MSSQQELEKGAAAMLVGRTIKSVRYMKVEHAADQMWGRRPIQIELDDGIILYPVNGDAGNDPGALHGMTPEGNGILIPIL